MKKLLTLLVILATILLTSCGPKTDDVLVSRLDEVRTNLEVPAQLEAYQLPIEINDVLITWSSNKSGTLTGGFITIQSADNVEVTLTASLEYEGAKLTKRFNSTILADESINLNLGLLNNAKNQLVLPNNVSTENLVLVRESSDIIITWSSSNKDLIAVDGTVVQPLDGEGDIEVTLTATLTLDEQSVTKEFIIVVLEATVTVDPDPNYTGYYLGAGGLEGTALKAFLNDLIDNHTVISYGDLRQALQNSDEDPDNPSNIILLYSGDSINSTWDSGATWNREHVWPKSLGGFENDDAGSDMHHLRPTYTTVNSDRGNKIFDEGGSLVSKTDDCYTDSDSFEPRDDVKGDVARMMFYMVVRYEGYDGANNSDLELVYGTNSSTNGTLGDLAMLLKWHLEDPVDEFEMNRNDVIYSYQNNRNPFIDHPEFVELIWGTN